MKKFRGLKLLGLVVILAFGLVFIGIGFVQGQVSTKGKPAKPPGQDKGGKYAWSAVILPGSDVDASSIRGLGELESILELGGQDGWLFNDSDENINVFAEIRGPVQSQYSAVFILEILYPVPDQNMITFGYIHEPSAEFRDNPPPVKYPELNPGLEYKYCRYPGCEDELCRLNPLCMFDFLQNYPHPYEGYEKVWFHIHSKWSYDLNEVDFEKWTVYENMGFWLDIPTQGGAGIKCTPSNLPEYNHILLDDETREYGYFEKIETGDENTDIWKVVGGRSFGGIDYYNDPNKNVAIGERYVDCVVEQINKNRTGLVAENFHSTEGSCDLKFEILFIRTKI